MSPGQKARFVVKFVPTQGWYQIVAAGHGHPRVGSQRKRLVWPGVVMGIGLAGTLDEIILHQLLHWHHFYDRGSRAAGLVSDGLFHLASTAALVAGLYWALAILWRDRAAAGSGRVRSLAGGVLVGLGGFNLYDGTIQHKVLRLHQVRPAADDWLPYDVVFIGSALLILAVGILILRNASAP